MSELVLIRHGETEWSARGQHTGVTDIPLTPAGEHQVSRLRPLLESRSVGLVLTSPRLRARRTAELLGWSDPELEPDLAEWDYGGYEGGRRLRSAPSWAGPGGSGRIRCLLGRLRARRWRRLRAVLTGCWLGLRPCYRQDRTSRSSGTGTTFECWPRAGSGWIRKRVRC